MRIERAGAESYGLVTLGKVSLGTMHSGKVATWENNHGKWPLGNNHLEKYLTSIFILVKFFFKHV